MATTFDVKTQGVDQLINRLKGFEPEIYKAMQREIKAAADLIGSSARGLIPSFPMDGWGPWEYGRLDFYGPQVAGTIKSRFRTRQTGGTAYVMGIVDTKSAAGSVYALAGSKSSGQFSEYLNSKWGTTYPRAMGPAWTMHVDKAREAMQQAVNRAAGKVTSG